MQDLIEKLIKIELEKKEIDSLMFKLDIKNFLNAKNWYSLKNPLFEICAVFLFVITSKVDPSLNDFFILILNIFLLCFVVAAISFKIFQILETLRLIKKYDNLISKNIFYFITFIVIFTPLFIYDSNNSFIAYIYFLELVTLNITFILLKKNIKEYKELLTLKFQDKKELSKKLKIQTKESELLKEEILNSKKLSILLYDYMPKNRMELEIKKELTNKIELNYYSKNSVKECLKKELKERKIENY